MTSIRILNATTPFLQNIPNSQISTEWLRFFSTISQNLGGGQAVLDVSEIESLALTKVRGADLSPHIDDLVSIQQSLSSLRDSVQSILRRIEDIERLVNFRNTPSLSLSSESSRVLNDVSTNASVSPVWVNETNSISFLRTSSGAFNFNPSTGALTCTSISGSLNGSIGSTTPNTGKFTSFEITSGGSTAISTGIGSIKMSSANAATNTAWIPVKYSGSTYFVPAFTTNSP